MLPLRWPAVTEAWLGKVKGTQVKGWGFHPESAGGNQGIIST
jgi:hypothetical protein